MVLILQIKWDDVMVRIKMNNLWKAALSRYFQWHSVSFPVTISDACHRKKYINIPSEKYIYMYIYIYVYICVYTYLCKMDEYRYYAGLSSKWMSTGIMLACHKNGWVPVLCWLVIKNKGTGLIQSCHRNECSPVSYNLVIKMNAVLSHTILS